MPTLKSVDIRYDLQKFLCGLNVTVHTKSMFKNGKKVRRITLPRLMSSRMNTFGKLRSQSTVKLSQLHL